MWPSMSNTTNWITLGPQPLKPFSRATIDQHCQEHRERQYRNGCIAGTIEANHATIYRGESQRHKLHVAQHSGISNGHHVRREARRQRTHNPSSRGVKLMRTPRVVSGAKCREQGHDTILHDWMTTVSLLEGLQVYRGRIERAPNQPLPRGSV